MEFSGFLELLELRLEELYEFNVSNPVSVSRKLVWTGNLYTSEMNDQNRSSCFRRASSIFLKNKKKTRISNKLNLGFYMNGINEKIDGGGAPGMPAAFIFKPYHKINGIAPYLATRQE